MDYHEYVSQAQQAANLVDAGRNEEAIPILEALVASDLPPVDKAIMCMNLAIVHTHLRQPEQALIWYAYGSEYERTHGAYYVTEHWAVYLTRLDRHLEALALYEQLLDSPDVQARDLERIENNIQRLQQLAGGKSQAISNK